jgi:hypothetical protein
MAWIALLGALAFAALFLRERARRKAAERDTTRATQEADRLAARVECCRLSATEDRAELGKVKAELAGARREWEVERGGLTMKLRAHGSAVECGQRREREAAARVREALDILQP